MKFSVPDVYEKKVEGKSQFSGWLLQKAVESKALI